MVIKIPIINEFGESCLGVIHRLTQDGIAINATAILSFNQAILAAKAGASYVLPKMIDHRYTRETVRQFVQDAEKTLSEMSKAKVRVATSGD